MKTPGTWSISIARMMLIVATAAARVNSPRFLKAAYRLVSDTTAYAPCYSEAGFASIRPGMTKDEVSTRLGPPLKILPQGASVDQHCYSETRVDGSYWLRIVVMGPDGRVARVVANWYRD